MDTNFDQAENLLINGKIGVLPTDTVYGIHGLALKEGVVEKLYEIRERNPQKPFIILISSLQDIELFKINLSQKTKFFLQTIWPNKVSVILPCPNIEFTYLHRGTNTLAFRLPKNENLLNLLAKTGPLISTSVNPQGLEPATTIAEAKNYFAQKLDFYVDTGTIVSEPSTVIKIDDNNQIEIVRQGAVKIDKH